MKYRRNGEVIPHKQTKERNMIKIEAKYKKDIKGIYIHPDHYHIVCAYKCKKSNKYIEYFIKIEKETRFYFSSKTEKDNNICNCIYFDFSYNFSLPAKIDDVLNIIGVECWYANNSEYDNANGIRNETVILTTANKLNYYSHKLHYPNFKPREIDYTFRYWYKTNKTNNDDSYVKIYKDDKGEF